MIEVLIKFLWVTGDPHLSGDLTECDEIYIYIRLFLPHTIYYPEVLFWSTKFQ